MRYAFCSFSLAAGCLLALYAQDSSKPQLTARELFYSASTDSTAKPPAKAPAKPVTPLPAPKTTPKKAPTPPPQVADKSPATAMPAQSQPPASHTASNEAHLTTVAMATTAPAPATGTPLGLKYTVLQRQNGDMVPVPNDTVFHAGDRIQFEVQTNGAGYLYIVTQGSSGTWRPIFPSPEVEDGDNRVEGWHSYTMPPKTRFFFDETTGVEKVFIVFSREPETDLERMIYSLDGRKPRPAATSPDKPQPKAKSMVEIASLNIDDATVGKLRTAYSRDLIIEKIDDKPTASKSEKKDFGVYVVNPSGSPDSRVVADIQLVHK